MSINKIDIKENYIHKLNKELLSILLKDQTSGKNIIWATDNYSDRGFGYQYTDYITIESITGYHGNVINDVRLEITCGEAPYLASRYDTVSGEMIELSQRIGLLDRKLRVVSENTANKDEWLKWAIKSFQNTYGYDWQGDNVLLARENLLFSFIDYYVARFGQHPSTKILLEIAEIISWNIWQMDGLKFVIPNSCHSQKPIQMSLFGDEPEEPCIGCVKNSIKQHNGIYCKIKDWTTGRANKFVNLIGRKS